MNTGRDTTVKAVFMVSGPGPVGRPGMTNGWQALDGNPMKKSHIRSQILGLPEADPLAGSPENPNAARLGVAS
jgi:hypothetical protein